MEKISPVIRQETKDDYYSIKEINDLAFGQENEGRLIESLRETSSFSSNLSLVAEIDSKIVGHILFYPVQIKNDNESFTVISLAPMAVHPNYQNKGIGSMLVTKGIETIGKEGYDAVIVVGHPKYYPRFGFIPANEYGIQLPFEVPDDVFLIKELKEDSLKRISGVVEYPKEYFDAM